MCQRSCRAVCLEHTDGGEIEPLQIGIHDMVGVVDLAVSNQVDVGHDGTLAAGGRGRETVDGTARRCDAKSTIRRGSYVSQRYNVLAQAPDDVEDAMPLNEHEQKILDEIERQLYEDDPKLAQKVAKAVRSGSDRWKLRLAAVVFLIGAVVMFATFTSSWVIAGLAFLTMVASGGWMAHKVSATRAARGDAGGLAAFIERLGHRWQQDD